MALKGAGQAGADSDRIVKRANRLAQRFFIVDGHVDVPIRLSEQQRSGNAPDDVSKRTSGGDFDYERAKAGGLNAPFMSIYVPSVYQRLGGAQKFADGLVDMVEQICARNPEKFAIATSPKAVRKIARSGRIALPMGIENGAAIEDSLGLLAHFHRRGVRYITLTHSTDNRICDSSYDSTRTWGGLSPFGQMVIAEMNRLGIMVDISHVSDSSFFQAIRLSRAPVIASHSSARVFTPGFERNLNDAQILELSRRGGVMMINFGSSFLDSTYQIYENIRRLKIRDFMLEQGSEWGDSATAAFLQQYDAEHPRPFSTVSTVADHIDHVARIGGIRCIGIGSDYDGVGDSLPTGLKDVSAYPNLIAELLRRGYSRQDIRKICYGNVFRVWKQVERG